MTSAGARYRFDDAEQPCPMCQAAEGEEPGLIAAAKGVIAFVPARRRSLASFVVAPIRHVATPSALEPGEMQRVWRMLARVTAAAEALVDPDGLHTWADIGDIADGWSDHYHIAVVPRRHGNGYRYAKPLEVAVVDERTRAADAARLRELLPIPGMRP